MLKYISCLILFLSLGISAHAEIRGAYITAWNKGFLTPQETDKTLDCAVRAKINTLYIQVRKTGDAYYQTLIEPMAPELSLGYDPLAYLIPRAHILGIEVHAWINVYRVWKDKQPPYNPYHIVNMYPDWLAKAKSGNIKATDGMFIDPSIEDYRTYMRKIVRELLIKYDLDGIHLDYVRYPDSDWGYPASSNWKRNQVSEMVKAIKAEIAEAKPTAKLSVSAICWGSPNASFSQSAAYKRGFQDWKSWLEQDYIDAVIPMVYLKDGDAKAQKNFRTWLKNIKTWKKDKPVYIGIDIYNNNPKEVLQQISAVGKYGLEGFVLFSLNETVKRDSLIDELAGVEKLAFNK